MAERKKYYRISAGLRKMLGEFYNETPGLYYCGYRAYVPRQQSGDKVEYLIRKNKTVLGPYTYTVENASNSSILVVSAEDYTGEYPVYDNQSGPNYLGYYTDALDSGRLCL